MGRKLVWDGSGLSLYGEGKVPDGTWGLLVFRDGALVDVLPEPVPVYTPPPCVPPPDPCGPGSGGVGGEVSIDPSAANLSRLNPLGQLLTTLAVEGAGGVTVTGSGAPGSPLRISAGSGQTQMALISSTPAMLPVTGQGTSASPYTVSHAKPANFSGGPGYGGFAVDSYGHIIGYADPGQSGVNQVTAVAGTVDVKVGTGVALLSLAQLHSNTLEADLGSGILDVDIYGRVTGWTPAATPIDSWRFVVSFAAATAVDLSFASAVDAQIKATVLGLPVTTGTAVQTPSGYSATLDGSAVNLWAVSGRLELKTMSQAAAGEHVLTINVAATVATPVIVDVGLCL